MKKIAIIGVGAVGVDICQRLIDLGDCRELVLVDLDHDKSRAEQLDFSHGMALAFAKYIKITAGSYKDTADSDIVVITAGATVKRGDNINRLDLAETNTPIVVDIARQIYRYAPRAVVIVVTNPCDVLAHFVLTNTDYPPARVISAGCILDSARLKMMIAARLQLDPKNIFAMVWGEHGESAFVPWSKVQAAGQPLAEYCRENGITLFDQEELLRQTKQVAIDIFMAKANTNHGIGASVYRLIRAIAQDEHTVLPVGVRLSGEYGIKDVVINVPAVIGAQGIDRLVRYRLLPPELEQLQSAAATLRSVISEVSKITALPG